MDYGIASDKPYDEQCEHRMSCSMVIGISLFYIQTLRLPLRPRDSYRKEVDGSAPVKGICVTS